MTAPIRLYMSMSLDGFVAGPNETLENGLGDGGVRLHEWILGVPFSVIVLWYIIGHAACR